MFHIKNLQVLNLDPILEDMAFIISNKFSLNIITSGQRPGDDGVHGTLPCRGLDLRCRDGLIGNHIAAWVNQRWQYDPARPGKKCAVCHAIKSGELHLHLQVHHDTTKRTGRW